MKSLIFALAFLWSIAGVAAGANLLPSNLQAPFCYEPGGIRRWPVLAGPLPEGVRLSLAASRDGKEVARGHRLDFSGLSVSLSGDGWLEIQSRTTPVPSPFELEVTLAGSATETQRLSVRAAPPPRPISYIADFGDDLIDLFMDRTTGRWRPLEKAAFDQYFRRVQAHGVRRLILWQSPFPYMADPRNYAPEDWQRYEGQARAIIESVELSAILEKRGKILPWGWIRGLMALRLTPQFGELLTQSAREHGIALTASFRPFEMALEKYYVVPAFDESGAFLWNFHPMASPAVDYHAREVGFAHYREVLAAMGRADSGRLHAVELGSAAPEGTLRIVASPFPPLQEDSFVLVRGKDGQFRLCRFREIQERAEALRPELSGFKIERDHRGAVRLTGIDMPESCRYLILSFPNPGADALDPAREQPATLWSKAGNQLGRANVYWVGDKKTRVAAISAEGDPWANFFAVEASATRMPTATERQSLDREQLVIDIGEPWSVEMVDFNQRAAREYVIRELRTILAHPPFDEIFINTRSHTSLAATMGDGADGVKPVQHYRAAKRAYTHLGLDRAYAPHGAASDARLRDPANIDKITMWQPGEWEGTCQAADSPFAWRYARNRGVADGVRRLLVDLEKEFPKTRIRAVIPEHAGAVANVKAALETMPNPSGGVYGSDYYRHLWASINHIPAIGEGMAMLDLRGLAIEPVFAGIRFLPDRGPFDLSVREAIADMKDNHGSSFHGPRSYFYEGHETLRAPDRAKARQGREERIQHLLDQRGEISEVILYEAAAWLGLPLDDADLCGHAYLDRAKAREKSSHDAQRK